MKLSALFHNIPILERFHWDPHRSVKKITSDSRAIEAGDVFVACTGTRMDGHDFLGQAIQAKASVIVCEKIPDIIIPKNITAIRVENAHACLAQLLSTYYESPDQKIKLVGVTGTNGKTTIAYLLHHLLREKTKAAYVGTLWYDLPREKIPAFNTTPGAEILVPLLFDMVKEKVEYCILEVSSHALEQRRVHGLAFELAIFTQLTQDHLDYHHDLESYFQAKQLLFDGNPPPKHMLINKDCPYGRRLLSMKPGAKSFSVKESADYQAIEIEPSFQGSRFKLRFREKTLPFQIRLPLMHNISNVVSVLASLDILGYNIEDFRGILQEVPGIPGRMESVVGSDAFKVFVDYAHTPDAIINVLRASKELKPKRILTLIGCGGDRDRSKRPLMTQAALAYSDVVMLTSDNPRSEDPETILADMKKGVDFRVSKAVEILEMLDRREAIEKLISLAEPGDVVFVLGKGHEDYQILGDQKIPFDDRLIVQECLKRNKRVFLS